MCAREEANRKLRASPNPSVLSRPRKIAHSRHSFMWGVHLTGPSGITLSLDHYHHSPSRIFSILVPSPSLERPSGAFLRARVDSRFDGPMFRWPAHVYARPWRKSRFVVLANREPGFNDPSLQRFPGSKLRRPHFRKNAS